MKYEPVKAARDATRVERSTVHYGDPSQRQRIEALLERYPRTSADETGEILAFLRSGNNLDVGLVSGSDSCREKVLQFRAEHHKHFCLKPGELALFLGATLGPVAALVWAFGGLTG